MTTHALSAPALHSVENAAVYLGGVSRRTVYELLAAGELRAVKIGRRSMIPTAELDRYIASLPAAEIGESARD